MSASGGLSCEAGARGPARGPRFGTASIDPTDYPSVERRAWRLRIVFKIKQFFEFFDLDLRVADQAAKQARLERPVIRNGEGLAHWISRMSQANMAAALADHFVSKTLERSDGLLS